MNNIRNFLNGQEKKGKIDNDAKENILYRITAKTNILDCLSDVDFVIDAVFENIVAKKEAFKKLDEAAPKEVILASNTSTLLIAEIAAATNLPDKCIGRIF
jgi:3-hydroxybutyryl-CoA dehydrogenase